MRLRRSSLVYGLLAVLLGVGVWWILSRPPSFTPPPLPDPNGYDDFVRAGLMLVESGPGDGPATDGEALRALVDRQAAARAVAREGLSRSSRVPVSYASDEDSARLMADLSHTKALARAFCAQALLEQQEGRTQDAVDATLDTFRLASESTRGGLLIHALVRGAAETLATERLRLLLPELPPEEARRAAARLETILTHREPTDELLHHERVWSAQVGTIRSWLAAAVTQRSLQPYKAMTLRAEQRCRQHDQAVWHLLLDLACRAYELDHGAPPSAATNLVPDYLKAVPTDPVSGQPMTP